MDRDPPLKPSGFGRRASSSMKFRTILDLPDELLSTILEDADDDWDTLGHALQFQLACRAYRERVLRIPSLWTRLSLEEDPSNSITRSGRSGLHIYISEQVRDWSKTKTIGCKHIHVDRLVKFQSLIKPHYARWKTFTVDDSPTDKKDIIAVIESLFQDLHGKVFPLLKKLELNYEDDDGCFATHMDTISVWRAPVLQKLLIRETHCIPLTVLDCCVSTLNFGVSCPYVDMDNLWASRRFAAYLTQSFENLECLDLWLSFADFFQISGDVHADLPRVRKLGIHLHGFQPSWILTAFTAPNVTTMKLTFFECKDCQPIAPVVSALFPKEKCRFSRLEEFTMDFQSEFDPIDDDERSEGLGLLLTSLPKISVLHLTTGLIKVPAVLEMAESKGNTPSRPPLRVLTLNDCSFVRTFVKSLKDVFSSPKFESLHVSKTNLVEEEVQGILPPDKELEFEG